ncbi:MAG: metallophosphoesterase [Pseudomonadota bacterium]|nr:metallophosphoesterase [Pseudomonadota bacterium]
MILHLTDLHFGTERPEVAQALLALAAQCRPGLIVLSGDITQRARARQFVRARAFVQQLCAASGADAARDVLAVAGNHDVPLGNLALRLFDPYGPYLRHFAGHFGHGTGSALAPVIGREGVCLIGVNTTRAWRHKHGQVSAAQVDEVAARLRAAPAHALKLVVTHQPLHVLEADDTKDLARGHRAALARWAQAGADLLLAGHIHQAFVAPVPGGPMWAVQSGTAVSRRTRQGVPNSVHVIAYQGLPAGQRAVVQRWDFVAEGAQAGRFAPVARTVIAQARVSG